MATRRETFPKNESRRSGSRDTGRSPSWPPMSHTHSCAQEFHRDRQQRHHTSELLLLQLRRHRRAYADHRHGVVASDHKKTAHSGDQHASARFPQPQHDQQYHHLRLLAHLAGLDRQHRLGDYPGTFIYLPRICFRRLTFLSDQHILQPLTDMLRQWRYIKACRRCGRAHDPSGAAGTAQAGLANECPACPQPGRNLPVGWEKEPPEKA